MKNAKALCRALIDRYSSSSPAAQRQIGVLFALLPTALFSVFVQGPTMRRAELLFDAGNRANRATLSQNQAAVGDAGGTLDSLLRAAELIEAARIGEGSLRMQLSRSMLQGLGGLPLFNDQRDFLSSVFTQAEPPVNGTLRQLLTSAVWRAPAPSVANGAEPLVPPEVLPDASCVGSAASAGSGGSVAQTDARGRLFVSVRRPGADLRTLRGLFVPQRPAFDHTLEVFSANIDPSTGVCTLGAVVLSSPETLDSRVVFDAGMRYFYYTVQGASNPAPAVIVQEVDWERSRDGQVRALQRQTLASITDPAAIAAVLAAAGGQRAAVLPTWRLAGGRQMAVGERSWRIVGAQALRVDLAVDSGAVQALKPAARGSRCLDLAGSFAAMPGFRFEHFETTEHCFMMARGWPSTGPAEDPTRPARDEIRVAVHERPSRAVTQRAAENPPAPLAGLVPYAHLAAEDASANPGPLWFVGTSGPFAGWLLMKVRDRTGAERFIGQPWSTCALWRLGRELQALNAPASAPQAGASRACVATPSR